MTEPESPAPSTITAWHPMLVALLEFYLPGGWQLLPEFLLNRMPLRVDIVILRLIGKQAGVPRKLHSILNYLRPHTLIEHKGPTDDLAAEDALALLGYAVQYMRLVKVQAPADLCLMVVCDRISRGFVEQIERHEGTLTSVGGGLWRGKVSGFTLHGVETRDACRAHPTERLLYAFSRSYLANPEGILPLDSEEARVYDVLYQQVEQFRTNRGTMAMKDYDAAKESYEEVLEMLVERLPPEKRLRGVAPEQRMAGLPAEELEKLVERLPPEKRLRGLAPEQRLAGLAPEEVAQVLTPEQRIAGLTVEQILSALTPEEREQFAKKLH